MLVLDDVMVEDEELDADALEDAIPPLVTGSSIFFDLIGLSGLKQVPGQPP